MKFLGMGVTCDCRYKRLDFSDEPNHGIQEFLKESMTSRDKGDARISLIAHEVVGEFVST